MLENYTHPDPMHVVDIDVCASYKDPPNKVKEILYDIAVAVPSVLRDPSPEVWVMGYGDHSVNYRVRAFIDDYYNAYGVRSEINRKVWYVFRRNSVEIPYPVRVQYNRGEERPLTVEQILGAFKSIDFLRLLKDEDLMKAATFAKVEVFGESEAIVTQGDEGGSCYFLVSGRADVYSLAADGFRSHVATLGPGDFFGEMSLLTGEPRSATVIAKEDSVCIVVGSEVFRTIFTEDPGLSEHLSELLAKRSGELEAAGRRGESRAEAQKEAQMNILNRIRKFFKIK